MYDNVWGYYLRDSGGNLCGECAFTALEDDDNGPRAWRAAVKLARMAYSHPDPDDVQRILWESSRRWVNYGRRKVLEDALTYHGDEVSACFDGQESHHGERCDGCETELCEPWATCAVCNRDDVLSRMDEWAEVDPGDSGDGGPTIICGGCATDWRDTIARAGTTITDDEWDAMRQATDYNYQTWGEPHPRLALVTEGGTWAPGRVLRPLRWQRLEEAGQTKMAV